MLDKPCNNASIPQYIVANYVLDGCLEGPGLPLYDLEGHFDEPVGVGNTCRGNIDHMLSLITDVLVCC